MNKINEFLNTVRSANHAGNTAMLSNLKKAEYKAFYAYPFVKDFCDVTKPIDSEIMATLAFVSAIVISKNLEGHYGNLGKTLASIYDKKTEKGKPREYHQTFIRIIESQNVKTFCSLIKTAIRHAISKDKFVDLQALGEDMIRFGDKSQREIVINEWCRGYLNS